MTEEQTTTPASGKLRPEVTSPEDLSVADRQVMWELFETYYASVQQEDFDRDLLEKDDVIVLRDTGDGTVKGFSTIMVYRGKLDGRRYVAVFSGDTLVDSAYWGQSTLHFAFTRYVLTTKLKNPLVPVYWILISKGYKTYLLLSRNFPEYWPRHDQQTPPWQSQLIDRLATERYSDNYDPTRGVISFDESHGHLKGWVAPARRVNAHGAPDIEFFTDRNPGHAQGDELCCIGRVNVGLLLQLSSRKIFRAPARRRVGGRRLVATS